MPNHWTYGGFSLEDDLQQGDILSPSEDLRTIFDEVHPHFLDNKYIAFVVLTQSCDLIRRKEKRCSATHISLAVVRTLESLLHTFLDSCCEKVCEGAYTIETRRKARDLLERLMNQNEQALGLFYLHTDLDAGITTPSVVLLRVTISLRSEHYQTLQNSRRGRLLPEFIPKLGWLTGNLYSRVGTTDWIEKIGSNKFEEIITEHLTGSRNETESGKTVWVKSSWVQAAVNSGVDTGVFTKENILQVLNQHRPPERKEMVIMAVSNVLRRKLPLLLDTVIDSGSKDKVGLFEQHIKKIENLLRNDRIFSQLLKKEN